MAILEAAARELAKLQVSGMERSGGRRSVEPKTQPNKRSTSSKVSRMNWMGVLVNVRCFRKGERGRRRLWRGFLRWGGGGGGGSETFFRTLGREGASAGGFDQVLPAKTKRNLHAHDQRHRGDRGPPHAGEFLREGRIPTERARRPPLTKDHHNTSTHTTPEFPPS